jgi:hypothetical protein
MKNLQNYGVQEMNAEEVNETTGGDFGLTLLGALVVAAAVEVMGDWEHFKDGLMGR